MRKSWKVLIPGLMLAVASGTALAHDHDGDFGLSLVVPAVAAAAVLAATPAYAAPRVYAAPPATYYAPPARVYYQPPARSYYYPAPPAVTVYYGRSHEDFDRRHRWHRERDRWGDDD